MEFASELVVKATLSGQRIDEVPTRLYVDGRSRPPHLRSWRDGWRHLRFLLLFSPRWLFFNPGIGAMLVGGAGMTVFGSAVWTPGRGRLSEGLLIASGGLVIGGFQAAQFALFARVFAATQRLLPATSRRTSRLTSIVTLEIGLVAAVVLVLSSLGLLGYSLAISRHSDPASAVATTALRLGAIAVVLGVLGIQTALGAWFLSVLGLRRVGARGTD
jgi:hypothetical protein